MYVKILLNMNKRRGQFLFFEKLVCSSGIDFYCTRERLRTLEVEISFLLDIPSVGKEILILKRDPVGR